MPINRLGRTLVEMLFHNAGWAFLVVSDRERRGFVAENVCKKLKQFATCPSVRPQHNPGFL